MEEVEGLSAFERAVLDVIEEGPVGCCGLSEQDAERFVRATLLAIRDPGDARFVRTKIGPVDRTSTWIAIIDAILGDTNV